LNLREIANDETKSKPELPTKRSCQQIFKRE